MAITINNFAGLVSYVTSLCNRELNFHEINHLSSHVEQMHEPVSTKADLIPLFNAICSDKKIEAIKEYRTLTGFGLKESKDEVERLMNKIPHSY